MQKALILIDYINDICNSDGKIPSCAMRIKEENIVEKVNKLLNVARKNNWLIIWIIVGFDKNYLEANIKSPIFSKAKANQALLRDSWGTEILSDLEYDDNELIICKNAVNPFHATNLEHVLRANEVTEVFLAGVSTEVAVNSCARDAHDRGYLVNVISDCCASGNIENHNATLKMLAYMTNVITSAEIII